MVLSIIAAVADNQVIGNHNSLIWHIPADLKYFKEKTMGHSLIMGRKTFDSIGRPLKGRTTIILTRQRNYTAPEGCLVAHKLQDAIGMADSSKDVFIAGGEQIYRQAISLEGVDRMYITRVFGSFEGDAFFPEIDQNTWELVECEDHDPDEKNAFAYSFQTFRRRSC